MPGVLGNNGAFASDDLLIRLKHIGLPEQIDIPNYYGGLAPAKCIPGLAGCFRTGALSARQDRVSSDGVHGTKSESSHLIPTAVQFQVNGIRVSCLSMNDWTYPTRRISFRKMVVMLLMVPPILKRCFAVGTWMLPHIRNVCCGLLRLPQATHSLVRC